MSLDRKCPECPEKMEWVGEHKGEHVEETGTDYFCAMCARTWRRIRPKRIMPRGDLKGPARPLVVR